MQWATHDLSKFYIILYDQLKKNTVVDGCVFTLSQLLDTVETDIRIELRNADLLVTTLCVEDT